MISTAEYTNLLAGSGYVTEHVYQPCPLGVMDFGIVSAGSATDQRTSGLRRQMKNNLRAKLVDRPLERG